MLILGVETTGSRSSLALLQEETVLAECSLAKGGRPQTERLLVEVRDLCQQQKISLSQIELLSVSRGPGSFTGLRVGLVFAKTFAYASGCAIKAVETFPATVFLLPEQQGEVEVVEDLRQGFVACQRFRFVAGQGWQPLEPIAAVPFEQWVSRPRPKTCLSGGGIERLRKQMPGRQFPDEWTVLPQEWQVPDARAVALLGREQFLADGGDDPFQVGPLYLRRSAAEERLDAM